MKASILLLLTFESIAHAAVRPDLEQAALICRLHHTQDAHGVKSANYRTGYEKCVSIMARYRDAQSSADQQTEKDNQSFVNGIATQK